MAVTIWTGRQPHGYEAQVLRTLSSAFEQTGVTCHLLANFIVNGHELDLLVLKPDAIFLVEMKQVWGAVRGAINGEWTVGEGRERSLLAGGSTENPYQQMLTQYRVLTEWLEEHKQDFLTEYDAGVTYFRPGKQCRRAYPPVKIRSLLAFYPQLPDDSELQVDWKVEPVSVSDLAAIVVHEPTSRVNLTDEEMSAIARQLNLTHWLPGISPQPPPALLEAAFQLDEYWPAPVAAGSTRAIGDQWRHFQLAVVESLILWLMQYCKLLRYQLHTASR